MFYLKRAEVANRSFAEPRANLKGEPEPLPEPVTSGAPVAGMLGLGLAAAACALGGAMTLRKKQFQV